MYTISDNILTFEDSFNEPIDNIVFEDGIKTIIFGNSFNQSIENVKFPETLKSITFGKDFKKSITSVNFPESLEIITLPRFYLDHYKSLSEKLKLSNNFVKESRELAEKIHKIATRKLPSDVIKDIFKLENEAEREEHFQKYISELEDDEKEEFKTMYEHKKMEKNCDDILNLEYKVDRKKAFEKYISELEENKKEKFLEIYNDKKLRKDLDDSINKRKYYRKIRIYSTYIINELYDIKNEQKRAIKLEKHLTTLSENDKKDFLVFYEFQKCINEFNKNKIKTIEDHKIFLANIFKNDKYYQRAFIDDYIRDELYEKIKDDNERLQLFNQYIVDLKDNDKKFIIDIYDEIVERLNSKEYKEINEFLNKPKETVIEDKSTCEIM
jgi:hypothetical protein